MNEYYTSLHYQVTLISNNISCYASFILTDIKRFLIDPIGKSVTEGDTITLDCVTGESSPPPDIFWEKDYVPFTGGSQYNATFKSASSLGFVQQFSMKLVMVATPEHSGKYNCAAKNRLLGITVRSLQVYVGVAGNNNLFQDMLPIY